MKILTVKRRNIITWGLFLFLGGLAVIFVIKTLSNPAMSGNPLSGLMSILMSAEWILLLAACLLALHAVWTLGYRRGLSFIILIFAAGLVSEVIGVNTGLIFGGFYSYQGESHLMLWGVPLMIPLFWGAFIYAGYNISTSFLYWLNIEKTGKSIGNWKTLLFLILLDGLIVCCHRPGDGPTAGASRQLAWVSGGRVLPDTCKQHSPAGFALTDVNNRFIQLLFEYFKPKPDNNFNAAMYLIPLCGYLLLCFGLIGLTIKGRSAISDCQSDCARCCW
jgi:hypothetical protein